MSSKSSKRVSLQGRVRLPGDKSISHRYAILGAMAEGATSIQGFSTSRDCRATLRCLGQLGVHVEEEEERVLIESDGWRQFKAPVAGLDAGNSGTTIRLMAALLAGSPFPSTISGDTSLNRRPMQRIITPLTRMGARIRSREEGLPPLAIEGRRLEGIDYTLPLPSAQVKSCLLLAGLMAQGETRVREPLPSRDHTERALGEFGVDLGRQGESLTVRGPARLRPAQLQVPRDFSSAIFFLVAALLLPGSHLELPGIGINPSRVALLRLLEESGANIRRTRVWEEHGEPLADLEVSFSPALPEHFPAEIPDGLIPSLIDEIPILAVLGTQLRDGLRIRGASELRHKESDRIHAIVSNLELLGIRAEEFEDGFFVAPGQSLGGGCLRSFGDHRISMAFTMAGLLTEKKVELDETASVEVSFPGFFQALERVVV